MSTGSISSNSSAFSFCHLTSSLDDDDFGGTALSSVVTFENVRKRDLRIQVPELKQQSYPLPLPPGATPNSQESPWKKGKLIYKGILGGIYHGFNSENGVMCAMKEVSLSSDGDKNQSARMLEKEIALLSRMRHPNIVQYYGSEMVDGKFCIYYEYMSRGSVYMILEQYGRLGESAIRSYTQHILSGLAYMHSKSIAHGDIKGANILLDPNGRVKLTNFGIEKQIAEKFHISWLMDSPYWMAPEVIMNPNVRNPAVDIWSLGCTVLEMATSKPPLSQYEGVMAMFKVAYHKELPTIPDHLSDVCKDFLRHCLQWNPLHRPTAFQLLEHPFVKGLSPSGERILVSASSDHSAVANSVKPECCRVEILMNWILGKLFHLSCVMFTLQGIYWWGVVLFNSSSVDRTPLGLVAVAVAINLHYMMKKLLSNRLTTTGIQGFSKGEGCSGSPDFLHH